MGTLPRCWVDYKMVQPFWKTFCQFLKVARLGSPQSDAGFFNLGTIDTWVQVILYCWGAVLHIAGCLPASLTSAL